MSTKKLITIALLLPGFGGLAASWNTPCDAEVFVLRHAWRMPGDQNRDEERRFGASGVLVRGDVVAIATDQGPDPGTWDYRAARSVGREEAAGRAIP